VECFARLTNGRRGGGSNPLATLYIVY
jgi:hypothetical protein